MDLKAWLDFHGSFWIKWEWTDVPVCQWDVEVFGRSWRWFVGYVGFAFSGEWILMLRNDLIVGHILESVNLASDADYIISTDQVFYGMLTYIFRNLPAGQ